MDYMIICFKILRIDSMYISYILILIENDACFDGGGLYEL